MVIFYSYVSLPEGRDLPRCKMRGMIFCFLTLLGLVNQCTWSSVWQMQQLHTSIFIDGLQHPNISKSLAI